MARLDAVSVQNFKLLKNVTLNLTNLNLLTGVNSSGKSTFIQAILLLMQNKETLRTIEMIKMIERNTDADINEEKIEKVLAHFSKRIISFNGTLMKLGSASEVLNQDAYGEKIRIAINSGEIKGVVSIEPTNQNVEIEFESLGERYFGIVSSLDDVQYLHTDRIQPQNIYDISAARVNEGLLGIHGEYTVHYLDENRRKSLTIPELRHPNSTTDQLLENVSCWLSEISQGIVVNVKKYEEIQKVSLNYQYTYGSTTSNEYAPMNVGFGLTYVLPIIVSLLKAKPDEIIIIENPESHLHPKGQVKIAHLCALAAQYGVQLIIESHSDHFLNGLRVATKQGRIAPENLKFFYFTKGSISLNAQVAELLVDENGRINDDWPEGFFDEYGKQMDELLW